MKYTKEYYTKNKEGILRRRKEWGERNKPKIKEYQIKYQQKYREVNKEKIKKKKKEYYEKTKQYQLTYQREKREIEKFGYLSEVFIKGLDDTPNPFCVPKKDLSHRSRV